MKEEMEKVVLLSETELLKIMLSAVAGTGETTKEQIEQAVEWAEKARLDQGLLQLVLRGELVIQMREENELTFKRPEKEIRERLQAKLKGLGK